MNELDNRASTFYIALYWSEFMAQVDEEYKPLAVKLKEHRHKIVEELKICQGKPVDLGGYYKLDAIKAENWMRPSLTLNSILDGQL